MDSFSRVQTHSHHTSNNVEDMFARCLEHVCNVLGMSWKSWNGSGGSCGESGMSSLSWINNIYKHLQKICSDYEKICLHHATSIAQSSHSHPTVIAQSLHEGRALIGNALPRVPVLIRHSLPLHRAFVYYVILAFLQCAGGAGARHWVGRHNSPYRNMALFKGAQIKTRNKRKNNSRTQFCFNDALFP